MANRILRDWTDSENIDKLSFQAEVLFVRLFMKADDYGCYHANPKLLNASLFPLKSIREADITRWLTECQDSGLIALYENSGKKYLFIKNFGQRLRTMKRKFPEPDINNPVSDLSATCQPETKRNETEVETETKEKVRDNVTLKRSEILKLEKSYSDEELNWMYDKLSAYKLSKGKRYKSDYGAILTWVVKSLEEAKEKSSAKKESKIDANVQVAESLVNKYASENE